MISDTELVKLAERAGKRLLAAGCRVVTAESCTAGWIAKALTDVPGSSQWFECGYVTYSDAAKVRDLEVNPATLATHGAVSDATVREMAEGALRRSGAQVALAVTGIAGPDGAVAGKPVGTVWFGTAMRRGQAVEANARLKLFKGNREEVRRKAVEQGLKMIVALELPDAR